jgi:hypothetical protein
MQMLVSAQLQRRAALLTILQVDYFPVVDVVELYSISVIQMKLLPY